MEKLLIDEEFRLLLLKLDEDIDHMLEENSSENELKEFAAKVADGAFERNNPPKHWDGPFASLHKAGEAIIQFPVPEVTNPTKAILVRVTEGFLSDLCGLVYEGGEAELRKALRAYIEVLEDLHCQM